MLKRYKKIGGVLIVVLLCCFSAFILNSMDHNEPRKNLPYTKLQNEEKNIQISSIDMINLSLYESWNFTTGFQDRQNETLLHIPNIEGYYSPINCTVMDLINRTNGTKLYPTEAGLSLWQQKNETDWAMIGEFVDIKNGSGYVYNSNVSTKYGNFAIGSDVEVLYNVSFEFKGNGRKEIYAIFQEERWVINYNSSFPRGNYTAIVSNLSSDLNLEKIRGFNNDNNWVPIIEYQFLDNLTIRESFRRYLIEFSVQVIDISYNDNLEVGEDLALYIVPKIEGNLTLCFTGVNNEEFLNETLLLERNEMFNYSWILNATYPGGVGKLTIEFQGEGLFNVSKTNSQILFQKQSIMGAELLIEYSESKNSTKALEKIYLVAFYVDENNNSLIPNGSIQYKIGDFIGEMDYVYLANHTGNPEDDEYLYLEIIDLSELRLRPDNYTVELIASKIGYETANYQLDLEITQVYCNITTPLSSNNHFDLFIGEAFEIDLDLLYFAWNSTYVNIQDNVILNFSVFNENGGLIDFWNLSTQYEDPELKGVMEHTYPGNYFIEIAVESPFYYGKKNISLTIKKDVNIYLFTPSMVSHPDTIQFKWINDGVIPGDMRGTVLILIDGKIFGLQPLLPISFLPISSNGLSAGQHVVQIYIESDYYTGQFIRTINVKASFWEQYGIVIYTILGVIAIASLALTFYLSRQKKLKEKEWASLGALMAIKDGMNMFTIKRSRKSKYAYKLSADEDLFTGMIEAIKNFAKEISLSSGDTTRFQGDQGMITIIPEKNRRFSLVFLSQNDVQHIESDLKTLFVKSLNQYYDVHIGEWDGDLKVFKSFITKAQLLLNSDSLSKAKTINKKARAYSYEIQS
jgi:hypothetical protein